MSKTPHTTQPSITGDDHRDTTSGRYVDKAAPESTTVLTLDLASVMDSDSFGTGDGTVGDLPDFMREVKKSDASKPALKWLNTKHGADSTKEEFLLDELKVNAVSQTLSGFDSYSWVAQGPTGSIEVPEDVATWLQDAYAVTDDTDLEVRKSAAVSNLFKAAQVREDLERRTFDSPAGDESSAKSWRKACDAYDLKFAEAVVDLSFEQKALMGSIRAHAIIKSRTGTGKHVSPTGSFAEPGPGFLSSLETHEFSRGLRSIA